MRAGIPGDEVADRFLHRLQEVRVHAVGNTNAERVTHPRDVLDGCPSFLAADPHRDDASLSSKRLDVRRGVVRVGAAGGDLFGGQRTEQPQKVGDVFGVVGLALVDEPLQLGLGALDDVEIEQLAQLGVAEKLGQQGGVQRQRLRPPLGQRRVALVHERRDVAEQQRSGERRRLRRLDLHHPDLARRDVAHQLGQAGQVVHVLQALAHRLQQYRERPVLRGHVEQLRRALPLLPQRRTTSRLAPRDQQRPGRALPEPGGEQRRRAHLRGDEILHLVWVDDDEVRVVRWGCCGRRRRRRGGARSRAPSRVCVALVHAGDAVGEDRGRVVERVRDAQHDAVVGVHRLDVGAVTFAQPRAERQRPRRVHLGAVRRMHDEAPVTQLIAEALHDDGLVVRHVTGGGALVRQIREQVVRGPLVEAGLLGPRPRIRVVGAGDLPDERADRRAQLHGPTELVALPERQPPGPSRRGGDDDAVMGDLLDPPAGGAEGEHVADAGLVDHLLVQLTHPGAVLPGVLPGEEDPVQAAVRDGAAAGHGEPLTTRAGAQGALVAVPDQPGAQLGELV